MPSCHQYSDSARHYYCRDDTISKLQSVRHARAQSICACAAQTTDLFFHAGLSLSLSRQTDDAYKKVDGLHPIPSILDLPSLQDLDSSDKRASGSHGLTLGDTISSSSSGADDSSGAPGFHTSHTSHQASLRNRHANGGGGGGGGTAVTAGNGGPLERVRQQQKLGVVSRSSSSSTVAEADEFNATAGAAGPEKGRKTSEQRQRDLRAKQDGGDGLRRDADVLTKVFVVSFVFLCFWLRRERADDLCVSRCSMLVLAPWRRLSCLPRLRHSV